MVLNANEESLLNYLINPSDIQNILDLYKQDFGIEFSYTEEIL